MRVQAVRTTRVGRQGADLEELIADHVPDCPDSSVLAVTSKVVALCQGRVLDPATVPNREELLAQESSRYLPANANRYHVSLAIKSGRLIPNAGIDQSNADGCLVLWPQDAQKAANQLRQSLCRRLGRHRIGVLITDSTTAPLRAGVVGVCVAHSGFLALRTYVGKPDLFGRPLRMTQSNAAEALAAAAVLAMGEGAEQTPLALITELPELEFQERDPSPEELAALRIPPEDDLYEPILTYAPWRKGRGL